MEDTSSLPSSREKMEKGDLLMTFSCESRIESKIDGFFHNANSMAKGICFKKYFI